MKKLVNRKHVVIHSKGFIAPLGITGPIDRPILLKVEDVRKLVMGNYSVEEVLKNGKHVKLDVSNYEKENGEGDNRSIVRTYEANFGAGHKNDKKVETIPDTISEDKLKEILQQSTNPPIAQKHQEPEVNAIKTQINDHTVTAEGKKNKKENFSKK